MIVGDQIEEVANSNFEYGYTLGKKAVSAYLRITSDSSLVTPTMRFVKVLLTKTDFQPVIGLVLHESSVFRLAGIYHSRAVEPT